MNEPTRIPGINGVRGVSLIELLVAVAVISVAMLGIIGMAPVAHQQLRVGGALSRAAGLAQRMIEQVRDEPLDLLPRYHQADTRSTASFPVDDPGTTPPFRGGTSFQRWREEITTASSAGGLPDGWGQIEVGSLDRRLQSVTVTVGWLEGATPRMIELNSSVGQE
jgi:prepilin-type N-terminal cleavage/methylation domain-containing protein